MSRHPEDTNGNPIHPGDIVVTRGLNIREVHETGSWSDYPYSHWVKLKGVNSLANDHCLLNLTALGYQLKEPSL